MYPCHVSDCNILPFLERVLKNKTSRKDVLVNKKSVAVLGRRGFTSEQYLNYHTSLV